MCCWHWAEFCPLEIGETKTNFLDFLASSKQWIAGDVIKFIKFCIIAIVTARP